MTLTSVKLQSNLFEDFRVNTIKHKFSLQKLTSRAIYLYNTNEEFRRMIHTTKIED